MQTHRVAKVNVTGNSIATMLDQTLTHHCYRPMLLELGGGVVTQRKSFEVFEEGIMKSL